jgi:uncharacterized membrane protein YdfJ with MMPL/SSD domain
VAFASLLVAGIQPVIDFGLMMSLGIVVGFLCTFLVVPSLMAILPEPTGKRTVATERTITLVFSGWVERYGNGVLGITAILAIATAVGISRLEVENRFIDYFKDSTEIYRGMELLDSKLGGTIPLDIILYAPDQGLSGDDATSADVSSTAMDNGDSRMSFWKTIPLVVPIFLPATVVAVLLFGLHPVAGNYLIGPTSWSTPVRKQAKCCRCPPLLK